MNPIAEKLREFLTARSSAAQAGALPATSIGLVDACMVGAILGVAAQFLRQVPGVLMSLGAATAPWVMVGFLLAVLASRGTRTPGKAVRVASAIVAAYLFGWLVSYHLLFVLRESVSPAAGWREAAPWLAATVPASPILGTMAALSHKRGLIGDMCLAVPVAWLLPEAIETLRAGWFAGAAVVIPVAVLAVLLIRLAMNERRVRLVTLLAAAVMAGAVGVALFPIAKSLIPSW